MGTNAHNVDIRNIPGHNPPLSQLELVSSGPNYYLWQSRPLSHSVIQYTFNMSSSSLLQEHIQSYIWRHNNPLLVSTAYFKQEEDKQKYSIFYQRVFTNLGRIKDLCFEDSLQFYYVGLKGFQLLFQHFDAFEVEEDMFHITQDSKVKVWCDRNIARIYPSTPRTTQQAMIRQIIQIIQQNTDHARAPIQVASILRQSARNFTKVIQRFVRLCKQCNFHLTNQLKCLYTIYRGGVENYVDEFAQSLVSKKKSYKHLQAKMNENKAVTKFKDKPTYKLLGLEQTKKTISYSSPKLMQFISNPVPSPVQPRMVTEINNVPQFPRSVETRQACVSPHRPVRLISQNQQPLGRANQNQINGVSSNNAKRFYKVNFQYKNNNPLSSRESNLTKRNIRNYNSIKAGKEEVITNVSPIKHFMEAIKTDEIPAQMGESKLITKSEDSLISKQKQEIKQENKKENQVTYKSMLQKLKAKYNSISYNNEKVPEFSYDYQTSTNHTAKQAPRKNEPQPINNFLLQSNSKVPSKAAQSLHTVMYNTKNEIGIECIKPAEPLNEKKYVPSIDEDIWRDMVNLKSKTVKF